MDDTEFQEYRCRLAKNVIQGLDKQNRGDIIADGKLTNEYQEARSLRRHGVAGKNESKAVTESLLQYAKENNLERYSIFESDSTELINTIGKNREEFENDILPNASDKLIDKVIAFTDGGEDEEILKLLKRANFDYESLLLGGGDEQTKAREILATILKAQTYDKAVEQNQNAEIDFSGFENDPDIPDVKDFIYRVFGKDLLQKCLISKVNYMPDKVKVQANGSNYLLPLDVYKEWESVMPKVKERKFRAESFVLWNTDPNFSKKFIPTPINFYSFYGEEPGQLDYLDHLPAGEKMRWYKLGTIAHEIAHHIYDYLMDADKLAEWKELVGKTHTITDYAKSYSEHKLKYDEYFGEAVRLKTTSPDYFEANFPQINSFLTDNFPDIKIK